jgi:hypothetical protein
MFILDKDESVNWVDVSDKKNIIITELKSETSTQHWEPNSYDSLGLGFRSMKSVYSLIKSWSKHNQSFSQKKMFCQDLYSKGLMSNQSLQWLFFKYMANGKHAFVILF